ncbi:MAG: diguanylate cyclase (GGDEF)-like protein/PAS domain S-box-containing protein [Janthinobacterium sp.]|jgi:diguanylate cyclase (GGDEF)-like protein/PAS domain S-box-containing protein
MYDNWRCACKPRQLNSDNDRSGVRFLIKVHYKITALLAGSTLMVGLGVASLFWSFGQIEQTDLMRRHSAEVIKDGHQLLSSLKDAETGQRGYILTANDSFLAPWIQAREELPANLKKLADNTFIPAAREHLDAIMPLANAQLKEMAQVIAPLRAGDAAKAIAIVKEGNGKQLMDTMRAEMAAFIRIEEIALAQREKAMQSDMRRLFGLIVAAALCGLLFALAFAWLIWRQKGLRVQHLVHLETQDLLAAQQQANQQLQSAHRVLQDSEEKLARTLTAAVDASARIQAVLNTVADGIITFDAKDKLIETVNPAVMHMFGYSAQELLGQKLNLLIPELDDDGVAHVPSGDQMREVAGRCKDGREFPMEMAISEMMLGDVLHCTGMLRDISARKRAEAALLEAGTLQRRAEEDHNRLFALSQDMLCTLGFDGTFKSMNPAWIQTLGYTKAELLATNFVDFLHPDDLENTQAEMANICHGNTTMGFENRYRCKDGSYRWLQWNATPVIADALMYAVARDITERKQGEASELRINAIAFESQESLMITDAAGVIMRVNRAFTETTGYASDEAVGHTPHLLKSDRHDPDFYRAMWRTLRSTGLWQGEVWNRTKSGNTYPVFLTISAVKAGDGIVTHYVGSQIDMTKRMAAEEMIRSMAFYDPLTGLPNRRLLMDQLRHALASSQRSGRNGAVLFIDLDNFKDINDTLGHNIGDLLLQQTALRLQSCLRSGDVVARLGGDEFVVMLENLSEHPAEAATQAEAVGEKCLAVLRQPCPVAQHTCRSTASIGAAMFSDHGQSVEKILKRADIAMYQSKKSGRNTFRFFSQQMQDMIHARTTLETELHKAIEEQQFHLYYQIQVDSAHRAIGAEGLIRWQHPERGLVSPKQFIAQAEETGLILPIGLWVLETACRQLHAWQQDALMRHLVLSVNVSAKQFYQPDFVAQIHLLVRHHAIDPGLLKLEITESMLQENIENTIAAMMTLKEIGVQFSLDDFGTGYSSLQYLKRLPLDQIKIDQSFVRDLVTDQGDQAIVSTIIAMAKSLRLSVIAEGVETSAQHAALLDQGCVLYQGYLFGHPVPVLQFEALVRQRAALMPT